jgi:hypothetical protein
VKIVIGAIVALLAGTATLASAALFMYCVYRHWSLPPSGRAHDVWGALMFASGAGVILFGLITVAIWEES